MVQTPYFDRNEMKKGTWSKEEDKILRDFVLRNGHANWQMVPIFAEMVRKPYYRNGMKKGAWSKEEDKILRDFVLRNGHANWQMVPIFAGLARCGKSCRLRWVNYLKPGLKRGNFTKQEEDLIIRLYALMGSKWAAMATQLPGRTDNEIKNYWHAHIKKRRQNDNIIKVTIQTNTEEVQQLSDSNTVHNGSPDQDNLSVEDKEDGPYFPPLTPHNDEEQLYYEQCHSSSAAGLKISSCDSGVSEFQGNNYGYFLSSCSDRYLPLEEDDVEFYVELW